MLIAPLSPTLRIVVKDTGSGRFARLQEFEERKWVTRTSRNFATDIRVNPVTAMTRVAEQRGLLKPEETL